MTWARHMSEGSISIPPAGGKCETVFEAVDGGQFENGHREGFQVLILQDHERPDEVVVIP